jgi:hypothetical protein
LNFKKIVEYKNFSIIQLLINKISSSPSRLTFSRLVSLSSTFKASKNHHLHHRQCHKKKKARCSLARLHNQPISQSENFILKLFPPLAHFFLLSLDLRSFKAFRFACIKLFFQLFS